MDAVEFLIERLNEQITLAPSLQQNSVPGGAVEHMILRLKEGMNAANFIPRLKTVEAGSRRYTRAMGGRKRARLAWDSTGSDVTGARACVSTWVI